MTTLGAVFLPDLPPERLRDIARAADEAGLEELWLWEDCFREGGIATVTAALAWTERLRVGIGVLPVPLRNVALTAMEAASIERMFPGRLRLGVGHGVQDWMGQVGERVTSPMTLLREYVTALRSLLAGEKLNVQGRYVKLDGVALDWPPPTAPEVLAAATGPRTLRLSGEIADGTVLSASTTLEAARRAKELCGNPVTVYLLAATGPDAAQRVEKTKQEWPEDPAGLGVAGDAATIAAAVRDFAAAGADSVILQPTPDDPDPAEFVRFVAQEVRPLVPTS
jgi:alkanesulfonate monooxygenase SsuD/methylene tetrahydromethanopterin reductase-like flavin-dependent oxidoreductase (luciferase family)